MGATKRDVLRFVLMKAALVGGGGVAVGLWLGIIVSGLVASVVGNLPARSPGLVIPPAAALVAAVTGLLPAVAPAGIARLVLAEQLYRAYSVLQNHPYHRE